MSALQFQNADILPWVLGAASLLTVVFSFLLGRGKQKLNHFISEAMQHRLADKKNIFRNIFTTLLFSAFCILTALGLAKPYTLGETVVRVGSMPTSDVLIVLDVSRSMLADDTAPTRLARAKAEVAQLTEKLRNSRLGLLAFAGRASPICPLTTDRSFFRLALRSVNTSSARLGGTNIGGAVRAGIKAFGRTTQSKVMVLITDGEDHDSLPLDAAKEAAKLGIRVITVGFGSETGSAITLVDETTGAKSLLTDRQGNPVTSRLDGDLLRNIALATNSVYVPAGTATLDLNAIVEKHILPMLEPSVENKQKSTIVDRSLWFIAFALLCFLLCLWNFTTPSRRKAQ